MSLSPHHPPRWGPQIYDQRGRGRGGYSPQQITPCRSDLHVGQKVDPHKITPYRSDSHLGIKIEASSGKPPKPPACLMVAS